MYKINSFVHMYFLQKEVKCYSTSLQSVEKVLWTFSTLLFLFGGSRLSEEKSI